METTEKNAVVAYYDEIAETYDESRFGNSYGRFIDAEERRILNQLLPQNPSEQRLEIACGTGRLTDYATCGLDASAEMLARARKRHENLSFVQAMADDTGFADESFDAVYTFHLLMHLEPAVIESIFREVRRVLKPGGTELSTEDINRLCGDSFSLHRRFGVLFLPLHKLPEGLRGRLVDLDFRLANGWLKETSSYLVFELIRQ